MDDQDELQADGEAAASRTENGEIRQKIRLLFGLVFFAAIAALAFGIIGLFTFSWVELPGAYRKVFNPLPSAGLIGGGLAMMVTSALGLLLCDMADDLSALRRQGRPL